MFDYSQLPIWSLLLVPVVIFILWLLFRSKQSHKRQQSTLSTEYFKGLNYLLNDEQGKALDVFVKLVESNWDTIDTHLTLGKIYRKNGEMDKAIKIHQGLIARPSLPETYRNTILLELGYDYLDAGWFDRAEGLFKEVLLLDSKSKEAHRNLILIYQQEKDWSKAIDIASDMYTDDKAVFGPMIAHYYCELADQSRAKGDITQLEQLANKALKYDVDCVRASIILADLLKESGDDKGAIKIYQGIEKQDPESMTLVVDSLMKCYENLSAQNKLYDYLVGLQQRHTQLFLQNVIATVIEQTQGKQSATDYLSDTVKQQPSLPGIKKLVTYKEKQPDADSVYADLSSALSKIEAESVDYQCQKCGYRSNTHYWLCPGCNRWGRVKPTQVTHVLDENEHS